LVSQPRIAQISQESEQEWVPLFPEIEIMFPVPEHTGVVLNEKSPLFGILEMLNQEERPVEYRENLAERAQSALSTLQRTGRELAQAGQALFTGSGDVNAIGHRLQFLADDLDELSSRIGPVLSRLPGNSERRIVEEVIPRPSTIQPHRRIIAEAESQPTQTLPFDSALEDTMRPQFREKIGSALFGLLRLKDLFKSSILCLIRHV